MDDMIECIRQPETATIPHQPQQSADSDQTRALPLLFRWVSIDFDAESTPTGSLETQELVYRATVVSSSTLVPRTRFQTKFLLDVSAIAPSRWRLPEREATISMPPLPATWLQPATLVSAVVVQCSLAPRRSSADSWQLRVAVALSVNALQGLQSSSLQVDSLVYDHSSAVVGVARLVVHRQSTPTPGQAPALPAFPRTPIRVRLTVMQLKPVQFKSSQAMDVALEFSVLPTDRTTRTKHWNLAVDGSLPASEGVVLQLDDIRHQPVCLRLYRHSIKERALQLAEAVVSLSVASVEGGDIHRAVVPLLTSESPTDRRGSAREGNDHSTVWGEVELSIVAEPMQNESHPAEKLAASIVGARGHVATACDVRGRLEIELLDAVLSETKGGGLLSIQWAVTPGPHVAKSAATLLQDEVRVQFHDAVSSTVLHWTTKERQLPSLHCSVTFSTTNNQGQNHKSSRLNTSPSKSSQWIGASLLHLSVLSAFPDEWQPLELPVQLTSGSETCVVRVGIRLRLVPLTATAVPTTMTPQPATDTGPTKHCGRLSVSSILVEGTLLSRHQPEHRYTMTLVTGGTDEATASILYSSPASQLRSIDGQSLSCRIASRWPPVVTFQLHRSDTVDGDRQLVAVLCIPLPAIVTAHKHLVSLSLPLATGRDRTAKRCGTLSLDVQYIDDNNIISPVPQSSTSLRLHRVVFSEVPPLLATSISESTQRVEWEVSLLGGAAMSDSLWTHTVRGVDLRSRTKATGFDTDGAIAFPAHVVAKLLTPAKWMLTARLLAQGTPLAQAVISIRGGWTAFAASERLAWHKLYAVGRRSDCNPTPIGEIQLSVDTSELETTVVDSDVDGWVYVQVLDATLLSPIARPAKEATVVFTRCQPRAKPQKTPQQWSNSSHWQWQDAVVVLPFTSSSPNFIVELEIDDTVRIPVAHQWSVTPYRSSTAAITDEWLTTSEGDQQALIHVRVSYFPVKAGRLSLRVHRLQNAVSVASLATLPITRFALRCSSRFAKAAAESEPKEIPLGASYTSHLHLMEQEQLRLAITIPPTIVDRSVPAVVLQLIGFASGLSGELCLAEATIPMASVLHTPEHSQWITLHSKHDTSSRVAVALVQWEYLPHPPPNASAPVVFGSQTEWHQGCDTVLTLWKKLFYVLDVDHNERVDLSELTALFVQHAGVFRATTDGQQLLKVLLPTTQGEANDHSSSTVSKASVASLFQEMDRNGDQSVEWLEFVGFMQRRLLALAPGDTPKHDEPMAVLPSKLEEPRAASTAVDEKRRKRREDPQRRPPSRSTVDANSAATQEEGVATLRSQVATLTSRLALEQAKSRSLQDELRSLRQSHRQLQLQQERSVLEAKTTQQFVQQAIAQHEEALEQRAATRATHHTASIVLQSRLRARMEQRRYQALKLARTHAAVRIQCAYRCRIARQRLRQLQAVEFEHRRRAMAAAKLQRFVRWHVRRRERWLLRRARELSAVVIQQYARRWLARQWRCRAMDAVETLQRLLRGSLARRRVERMRAAIDLLKWVIRGWLCRWRWRRQRRSVLLMQRWWREATRRRWEYVTQLEAAVCIQAMWRGAHHRFRMQTPVVEQEKEDSDGEVFNEDGGDEAVPIDMVALGQQCGDASCDTEEAVDEDVRLIVVALVEAVCALLELKQRALDDDASEDVASTDEDEWQMNKEGGGGDAALLSDASSETNSEEEDGQRSEEAEAASGESSSEIAHDDDVVEPCILLESDSLEEPPMATGEDEASQPLERNGNCEAPSEMDEHDASHVDSGAVCELSRRNIDVVLQSADDEVGKMVAVQQAAEESPQSMAAESFQREPRSEAVNGSEAEAVMDERLMESEAASEGDAVAVADHEDNRAEDSLSASAAVGGDGNAVGNRSELVKSASPRGDDLHSFTKPSELIDSELVHEDKTAEQDTTAASNNATQDQEDYSVAPHISEVLGGVDATVQAADTKRGGSASVERHAEQQPQSVDIEEQTQCATSSGAALDSIRLPDQAGSSNSGVRGTWKSEEEDRDDGDEEAATIPCQTDVAEGEDSTSGSSVQSGESTGDSEVEAVVILEAATADSSSETPILGAGPRPGHRSELEPTTPDQTTVIVAAPGETVEEETSDTNEDTERWVEPATDEAEVEESLRHHESNSHTRTEDTTEVEAVSDTMPDTRSAGDEEQEEDAGDETSDAVGTMEAETTSDQLSESESAGEVDNNQDDDDDLLSQSFSSASDASDDLMLQDAAAFAAASLSSDTNCNTTAPVATREASDRDLLQDFATIASHSLDTNVLVADLD